MPIRLFEEDSRPSCVNRGIIIAIGSILIFTGYASLWVWRSQLQPLDVLRCAQPPVLAPSDIYADATQFLSVDYHNHSIGLLSGAIQIPTESYDDLSLDPAEDPRFKALGTFQTYLARHFPRTWMHVEKVNSYGLLFTLPGSDPGLKPVLLMAHQDVVPVNPITLYQWNHPPYSGYYDGEFIWGRGSSDTKNSVIGILEATENLLQQAWQPKQGVLISFGFDEELGGYRGAKSLAEKITSRYGPDSIDFIVDEGTGLSYEFGALFALPATAEKGYVDIKTIVETPGGHSSTPPDHSGIGFAAQVVTELEGTKLFEPSLDKYHPLISELSCFATYSPDVDTHTRKKWLSLASSEDERQSLAKEFSSDRFQRSSIITTQAVDVIGGGVKVNALPEVVEVTTNYRINLDSSVSSVLDRYIEIAALVAKRNGLGLLRNNETLITPTDNGALKVSSRQSLEPVPSSPTSGRIWDLIGGITRHVYEDLLGMGPLYFSPSLISGNTDTRHYLNLTRSIYRYTPMLDTGINIHTVDEHISADGHIALVMWYYEFLQVV